MRFLLDENVHQGLAAHLVEKGHDVTVVAVDYPSALGDREILAHARAEERVVITFDLDFGRLVFAEGEQHTGVVLFRLRTRDLPTVIGHMDEVLNRHLDRLDEFVVVDERAIRRR